MKRTLATLTALLLLSQPALAEQGVTSIVGSVTNANDTVSVNLQGGTTCAADISGTWSGTITFEGSIVSGTWFPLFVSPFGDITSTTTTTNNGQFAGSCAGLVGFRTRFSTASSGTANITVVGSPGLSPIPIPAVIENPSVPVTQAPSPFSFFTMSSQTTNQVIVTGAGTYYGMASISTAAQTNSTTCWDNTTNSGTILGATLLAAGAQQVYSSRGIHFSTGLTCKNSAALTGNGILVLYTSP